MKQRSMLLLLLVLLLASAGCRDNRENTHRFYYLRSSDTIVYGQSDGLIAPLNREIADQSADLNYLLRLYFEGPTEEGFQSPFPGGTALLRSSLDSEVLTLEVSGQFASLENIQLTLAGACLTSTCHELTGAQTVVVLCGENSYRFHCRDYEFLDVIDTQSGKETQ